MAVVANQAVAFDKSMLTACRFKPANVPIEERTTGGPHLGDVLRPELILELLAKLSEVVERKQKRVVLFGEGPDRR
jgi:hypothetical protein